MIFLSVYKELGYHRFPNYLSNLSYSYSVIHSSRCYLRWPLLVGLLLFFFCFYGRSKGFGGYNCSFSVCVMSFLRFVFLSVTNYSSSISLVAKVITVLPIYIAIFFDCTGYRSFRSTKLPNLLLLSIKRN